MLARWAILAMAVTTLGGCGSISSSLGLERHVPDESQVVVRPALTLPPDYDLMPPGTPTPVSSDHENGLSKGGKEVSSDAAQPKPERGFFSRVFDFDWFGGDSDKSPAAPSPSSTAPGPNIDGTPQTPPPSQSAPAVQSTPSNDPGPNIDGTPQAPAKSSGLDVRSHLAAATLGDTLSGERSGNDLAAA
jgi:hypothetical protein